MKLEFLQRTLRFATPVATSYGELRSREIVEVVLEGEDGIRGRGEASPLEPYDGVALETVLDALERYAGALAGVADDVRGGALLDSCREVADIPQALASIDTALWDRAGRRQGRSVASMLSDAPARAIAVNASIGAVDPGLAGELAARAAREGYRCVKVKVGVGDDLGRVAAVRAAVGPTVALRVDANGGWGDPDTAIAAIAVLEPSELEWVEEPVHGLDALREVHGRVAARIAMDESASQPGALAGGTCDVVCLKLSACGGISGLLAAASLVRATGGDVCLSSTYDGPLGVAAALHAAAALAPLPACGLATLGLFDGEQGNMLPAVAGRIAVPEGPGLGLS